MMTRYGLAITGALAIGLAGCGGGGNAPAGSLASKKVPRMQVLAAARITRSMSAATRFGRRAAAAVALRRAAHSRGVTDGQDVASGLYYVLTSNTDGSGNYALFTDAAHQAPAGTLSWPVPDGWTAQSQTFPTVIHVTYNITAGTLKGDHGTENITIKDSTGLNDLITIKLQDQLGEEEDADVTVDNGEVGETITGTSADGAHLEGQEHQTGDDGDVTGEIHFPNGHKAKITLHKDGSQTVELTGQNGEADASENNQSGGQGHVDFHDGTNGENDDINDTGDR